MDPNHCDGWEPVFFSMFIFCFVHFLSFEKQINFLKKHCAIVFHILARASRWWIKVSAGYFAKMPEML